MHAMILAAGRGERMRPLTDTIPKPLLRVAGKCLIEHTIERLVSAGFSEIVINHAYLGEQITQTLGDGSRYGAKIRYSPEGSQVLGTGGGIFKALPLLGNAPFAVVSADIWYDYPLAQLPRTPDGLAHLILVDNPYHHPAGDFCLMNRQVYADGATRLTFSGIAVYHPDLFKNCQPGVFPLAPLLLHAMQSQQVTGEHYQGLWLNIDTPERLQRLKTMIEK